MYTALNRQQDYQYMPSSLLKFYFKWAFPGLYRYIWLFLAATLLSWSGNVIWPFVERMIVSMFENATIGPTVMYQVLPSIAIVVGLNMGMTISGIMRNHLESIVMPGVVRSIQQKLTDYIHSQSLSFWHNRMPGSVGTDINYCVTGARTLVTDVWLVFVRLLMIVINSALLFTVNKYIAFVFIFMFVLRAGFMWGFKKPIKKSAENRAAKASELSGKTIDGFSNNTVVKLFSSVKSEHDYLEPVRQEHYDASRLASYIQRLAWVVPGLFWDVMLGVTLVLCAILYGRGVMSLADIVYSTSVYFNVTGAIGNLMNSIPGIIDNMASAKKGYSSLVVPIQVVDKDDATNLVVRGGKIEFKNISFKYRNKRKYVLREFSLTIKPGERVGLVGLSGAGKTTLVNLLMRFYDVDSGKILIDGVDIRDVTQNSLRENISFIPQEATMFNRTIRENIAYGNPTATDAQIRNAAIRASAHKFIMATEKKYDSYVGDRGIKLSGGQRQRIAIARAFLKRCPILVLDEATSALDSETEVAIQKSFETLSRNRTTIAIAHRLSTLRNMDRIVVMDKGRIVESGTHNVLLKKRGLYARLWKMQSGGFLQEK